MDQKRINTISVNITVRVLDMKNGVITRFVYEDQVFKVEADGPSKSNNNKGEKDIRDLRRPGPKDVIETYIIKNNLSKFSLKRFYQDNPKQKYNVKRIDSYVARLICEHRLTQVNNNEFIVN